MSHRLGSRLGHIADLARDLHAMECGLDALDARLYHALALRLRRALSTVPDAALWPLWASLPVPVRPVLAEALQARHFASHGRWPGEGAAECEARAQGLWIRLQRRA